MHEKRITVWVQKFNDRKHLVLQWHDPITNHRRSRSAKTADPKEAEDVRADLEYELSHGKYLEASQMTWERFREQFEDEHLVGTRPNTQLNYKATFDSFERICNPGKLRAISGATISAFLAGMRKVAIAGRTGMQATTIRVRLQFLRSALHWAVTKEFLPKCPNFPCIKVPHKTPQAVPAEAFEKMLFKAPDQQMETFLLSGWLAGLRLSEAMQLEWEPNDKSPYVDFAQERIILPAEFAKAVKDQWVPLDALLRTALERLPRQGKKVFHICRANGKLLTRNGVSFRVRALARLAGVKLSMRSLRRGFGCRYAGKVPAQVLQKLMRHSNITITMNYYANVDDAVEEAILGRKRNDSRNSPKQSCEKREPGKDVSAYGLGAERPSFNEEG